MLTREQIAWTNAALDRAIERLGAAAEAGDRAAFSDAWLQVRNAVYLLREAMQLPAPAPAVTPSPKFYRRVPHTGACS